MRTKRPGDAKHLVGARHHEVEHSSDGFGELPDVLILDMPAIFTKVRGDSVGAGLFAQSRGRDRVGLVASTRLSDGRDVIHVDVQSLASRWFFCCCHFGDPLVFAQRPEAEHA